MSGFLSQAQHQKFNISILHGRFCDKRTDIEFIFIFI
jgi:hypothetical protein